jgi:sRNA-binding carbon storage regulator CsrA
MDVSTLHLRRKQGEAVIIGEPPNEVVMIVGQSTDGETHLIFKAPAAVTINRLEVSKKKYRQS